MRDLATTRELFRFHAYVFDGGREAHSLRPGDDELAGPRKADAATDAAILEFLERGSRDLLFRPSCWFDPQWYAEQLPSSELKPTNSVDALAQYLTTGTTRDIRPFAHFDPQYYRARYSQVRERLSSGPSRNVLEDYLLFGGRAALSPYHWFEEGWYIDRYADVREALMRGTVQFGFQHFLEVGLKKRRDPGSRFSERRYLGENQDVADMIAGGRFASGFDHWAKYGQTQGRNLGQASLRGMVLTGAR